MDSQWRLLLLSCAVILALVGCSSAQDEFGFWVSTVECKTPEEKPIFNFDGEMKCGCVKGGGYSGPCYDLGLKVSELPPREVEQIAAEMSRDSPAPIATDQCQQLPQQFIDSTLALYICLCVMIWSSHHVFLSLSTGGTADTGANFDEVYDAAVNSQCNQTELEWRARDCRDALIPAYQQVQDRSTPYCPLECEVLFLNVSTNCPRVYELLKLGQFADICPGLKTVQVSEPTGAPVVPEALVPSVVEAVVPAAPAVEPVVADVAPTPDSPTTVAAVPEVAPSPEMAVPDAVAPLPTAAPAPTSSGLIQSGTMPSLLGAVVLSLANVIMM